MNNHEINNQNIHILAICDHEHPLDNLLVALVSIVSILVALCRLKHANKQIWCIPYTSHCHSHHFTPINSESKKVQACTPTKQETHTILQLLSSRETSGGLALKYNSDLFGKFTFRICETNLGKCPCIAPAGLTAFPFSRVVTVFLLKPRKITSATTAPARPGSQSIMQM